MTRIAFLGVGIMGTGMIRNLQRAGYKLNIYNRDLNKAKKISRNIDRICTTPRIAANDADIIIASISDDKASNRIWFGKNGVCESAKKGTIVIETSTLSIPYIDIWASKMKELDLEPVDCPVSGSKKGAAEATLSLFVGSNALTFNKLNKVFSAISQQVFYFGDVGKGMRFKLIYNMLGSTILVGLAEALGLSQAFGLDIKSVVKVLADNQQGWSAAAAKSKGLNMALKQHSEVSCSLKTLTKDIKYAINSANYFKKNLPTSEAAMNIMKKSCRLGGNYLDMSVVGDLFIK